MKPQLLAEKRDAFHGKQGKLLVPTNRVEAAIFVLEEEDQSKMYVLMPQSTLCRLRGAAVFRPEMKNFRKQLVESKGATVLADGTIVTKSSFLLVPSGRGDPLTVLWQHINGNTSCKPKFRVLKTPLLLEEAECKVDELYASLIMRKRCREYEEKRCNKVEEQLAEIRSTIEKGLGCRGYEVEVIDEKTARHEEVGSKTCSSWVGFCLQSLKDTEGKEAVPVYTKGEPGTTISLSPEISLDTVTKLPRDIVRYKTGKKVELRMDVNAIARSSKSGTIKIEERLRLSLT